MPDGQTPARGPAHDALVAGGTYVVGDGLVPAARLAHTYRARLRRTQNRSRPTTAPAATVGLLFQAAEEPFLETGHELHVFSRTSRTVLGVLVHRVRCASGAVASCPWSGDAGAVSPAHSVSGQGLGGPVPAASLRCRGAVPSVA
ncbi:hypothetical protein GCM10010358_69060 [Streptomyces minutiscleroticus]|uniref:Uncharacterized protein n=1 Tax=Streptomyces minutiscleroticus TaxID=68238 RepID=A0A918U841_9ACTN|nr:hypothetical protein GCM10010358_69060 [Streptomyces minutiscleroticus]